FIIKSFTLFLSFCHNRLLHSFPTRRSSDLPSARRGLHRRLRSRPQRVACGCGSRILLQSLATRRAPRGAGCIEEIGRAGRGGHRSEEHTSELQSRENLVCRLLLEKKKKRKT